MSWNGLFAPGDGIFGESAPPQSDAVLMAELKEVRAALTAAQVRLDLARKGSLISLIEQMLAEAPACAHEELHVLLLPSQEGAPSEPDHGCVWCDARATLAAIGLGLPDPEAP